MDSSARQPRVAVNDPELHARLAELLAKEGVEVELIADLDEADLGRLDAVVVEAESAAELEQALSSRAREELDVVVLGVGEDGDQARMAAAGASAVLDPGKASADLRAQLTELVEAAFEDGQEADGRGLEATPRLVDFRSKSPRMRAFIHVVERVAGTDSTLLITGETGVGKERLARAIHAASPRREGPFVSVNCGALPEQLLASELFGHMRGAFTGATEDRVGRFEQAGAGTIFLDEIGEMPANLQVHLLSVLQRRELRRVGATETVAVEARVMAATNKDLVEEVRERRFREDLFFRLNVVGLELPPVRERREDVPLLIGRFIRYFVELHGRDDVHSIDDRAIEALLRYAWPGNVREITNVVERAVLLSERGSIQLEDLPRGIRRPEASADHAGSPSSKDPDDEALALPLTVAKRRVVEAFERRYLEHHLRATRGRVGETAHRAGLNPRTIYEKMRRLGLRKSDYR